MLHALVPLLVVTSLPAWITAQVIQPPGGFRFLEVCRSLMLPEDDEWFGPVRRFLAEHETTETIREVRVDDGWMLGRYEYVLHRIEGGSHEFTA